MLPVLGATGRLLVGPDVLQPGERQAVDDLGLVDLVVHVDLADAPGRADLDVPRRGHDPANQEGRAAEEHEVTRRQAEPTHRAEQRLELRPHDQRSG